MGGALLWPSNRSGAEIGDPQNRRSSTSRENRATTHKLMLLSSVGRLTVDRICPFGVGYDASPVVEERQG